MEFWIPYGETEVPVRVPDDNFYKILEPAKAQPKDPSAMVSHSLENSVGGVSIPKLFQRHRTAGIIIDPTIPQEFVQKTVELLVSQLEKMGAGQVSLFVRRRTSHVAQLGTLPQKPILVDPSEGPFTEVGKTSSGTPVRLRDEFLNCDVRVCLCTVAPHFAAGFTGGPEAILPGVSSAETVTRNRSLLLQGLPRHDGTHSPVLTDTLEACRLAGPLYALSFVPDGLSGIDSVFSGELEPTFREATSRFLQIHSPKIDRKPDIAIMSAGTLAGADLYHSVRILSNAWDIVRKEGTIILAAECAKGIGDQPFLDFSRGFEDRKALSSELRHHFKLGAHVTLMLKEAVERNRIQLVSVLPDHYVRMFNLKSAKTASAAIQSSIRAEGKDAKILIVTRGDLTLPVLETS